MTIEEMYGITDPFIVPYQNSTKMSKAYAEEINNSITKGLNKQAWKENHSNLCSRSQLKRDN